MPVCPRCHANLKKITQSHKRACSIPTPQELARTFIDEPTTTTTKLARRYDVHRDFMEKRLSLGGIPPIIQSTRGYSRRRIYSGSILNEEPAVPFDKKECQERHMLISINDPHNMCGFCRYELFIKGVNCYESQSPTFSK
jgi:hypothetical protein